MYKANSGVDDPSLLADDFRFEFPVVSLAKEAGTSLLAHISKAYSRPAHMEGVMSVVRSRPSCQTPITPIQEL